MLKKEIERLLLASNDWGDFNRKLGDLVVEKDKGDAFELLTQLYLKLNPKYAVVLRYVWLLEEVPSNIRNRLRLPKPDQGIDLIAETVDGTYWAIQCKYHSKPNNAVTFSELSTFTSMAFGACKNIEHGLVCTTANRYSSKLSAFGDRLSYCAGDVWRELDEGFFRRLKALVKDAPEPLEPFTPRSHQYRAVQNAKKHFVEDRAARGKLIMPCASGKSLSGYWIADSLNAKRSLIAVPSLALVKQTLDVWAREAVANGKDFRWLVVCSDQTVKASDDESTHVADIGVHVKRDVQEISQWLIRHRRDQVVVLTTYQSGRVIAEASSQADFKYDLGIMDEAHKTVGPRESLFAHLLFDENIKIAHRVFMTATERRYDGNSERIVSMSDPNVYGDTFDLLSFKEAVEADPPILCDYQVVTIVITHDDIADLIQHNVYVRPDRGHWDDELEANLLASMVALRKIIHREPVRHAVSFHSSIARAESYKKSQDLLTKAFREYGGLDTFHVSGKLSSAERKEILDLFAVSSRSLITNARCLTEGVDVPGIDCILFADPKHSTVDIVQAAGRALRLAKDKKHGYILIPVILPPDQTPIEAHELGAFDTVSRVLRALGANDERIIDYFRSVSVKKRTGRRREIFSINMPLGVSLDTQKFVDSVELALWDRLAKLSWRPFEKAREFVRSLGIGGWEEWSKYKSGKLPEKGTLPPDIPAKPDFVYRNQGWENWGDWLGTGTVATQQRKYWSYEKASIYVRKLGLRGVAEWERYCSGKLPNKGQKPILLPQAHSL